jgi:large subunit ribosomal protein L24e
MTKCVFCGGETHDFMGVHLIKNDGTIDFYCSSKCRKNSLKLNRDKRNMKWTVAYKDKLKSTAERAALQARKASDKVVSDVAAAKVSAEKSAAKKKK